MKLTWYGHASFRIAADDGVSVVTDPYDPATSGYKPVPRPADVVVISSATDSFHCNAHLVPGSPVVVNSLELARSGKSRTVRGLTFRGAEAAEAPDHRGGQPEANGMVRFTVDGLSVGHMGDVGTPLSEAQLEFFEGVDVLFALAGGHPTIPLDALKTAVDILETQTRRADALRHASLQARQLVAGRRLPFTLLGRRRAFRGYARGGAESGRPARDAGASARAFRFERLTAPARPAPRLARPRFFRLSVTRTHRNPAARARSTESGR